MVTLLQDKILRQRKKEKYDEEKLTKFVGNLFIILPVILMIGGFLALVLRISLYIKIISWVLLIFINVSGVIYMNSGNCLKK
ncbi:MAG TPA: DUF3784 domain-containing protein [Clostridiales bacterium]|nr:DUF3784 domain-containing protein [Clostridiales bacterium]